MSVGGSDYLPPVVAEIILRTAGFEQGSAKVREGMASTAASVDASASQINRSNLRIATSAREAGEAARAEAAAMGKSAEEQAAAAGKAAEAFTVAQAKMTAAQKAAGLAAAEAAAAAKASTTEQQAAYARAAAAAEVEGEKISASRKLLGETLNNAGLAMGGALGRPLRGIGRQLDETQHKARSFVGTLGEVGKVVTYGGILGFVGAAYEGVKAAQAYQTSLAQIAADSGQRNAQQIGQSFLGTMGSSAFSAAELAQSYAQVSQQLKVVEGSTLNAAQADKVMAAAADLAKGAQTDLGSATSATAQVMQAYHLGVNQASQAADTLYSTSRATDSSVSAIATSMGRLHSRLGAVTPSLKDVGGLMVGVAQTGLTGSRGILQVSSAIQTLLGGTTTVDNLLARIHVGLTNASGGFVGMRSTIAQLHTAFQGLSPQMQLFAADTLFGRGAAQVMLQVIDKGTAAFQRDAQAADKAGSAHAAAAAQGKTLADQLEVIKSTIADVTVAFGQIMIPVIQKVGTTVAQVVNWFDKNKVAAVALAGVITGVLGAAITVFVASKVASLIKGTEDMVVGLSRLGSFLTGGTIPALERTGPGITGIGVASASAAPEVESLGAAAETTGVEVTSLGTESTVAGGEIEAMGTEASVAAGQMALFGDAVETTGGQMSLLPFGEAAGGLEKFTADATAAEGIASRLLGALTSLGGLGTISIAVAVAVSVKDIASTVSSWISNNAKGIINPASPMLQGLLGEHALGVGSRNPNAASNSIYTGGVHTTAITGNSPPWVQLGITQQRWDTIQRHGGLPGMRAISESPAQRARAQQAAVAAQTEANRVINRYSFAAQDTGVAPLERVLGIRGGAGLSAELRAAITAGRPTTGILAAAEGGRQQAGYEREISQMRKQGLSSLIPKLVAAHKAALDSLSQQLVAQQALKDSTSLSLESASLTDQTKAAQDAAATEVAVVKDQQTIASQAMQAAAKNISDASSVFTARMSAVATRISDSTAVGQDRSSMLVQQMSDANKVQADILGERMLYGYELVAQRLQVQLDATKAGFDKQIALQQIAVDETKQHWDGKIAAAQIEVARVTQHNDQLVAIAQQRESITQMHADTLLGNAQQQSDTAQLAADVRVALAQNAVTLSQSSTPAQKQAAQNTLTLAQAQSGVTTAQAAKNLQDVTASTQMAVQRSAGVYQRAQAQAAKQDATAQAKLARYQAIAQVQEADQSRKLTLLNETMNKVVQKLQDQITLAQAGGGRRIRSDATSLAYTGLGAYGRGGGGHVVMNLGPPATGVGIAQETRQEKQYMQGKGLTINGGVHIHGAGQGKDEIVSDFYHRVRPMMTGVG